MKKKKFNPRGEKKEEVSFLDSQPIRDPSALLVPIESIIIGNNVRREIDQEKLIELAESIKIHGVIQPILLTETNKGLELVCGRRRLEGSKMVGLQTIPAKVTRAKSASVLQIIENIQRISLDAFSEAEAVNQILKEFKGEQQELARQLGKGKSYITKMLKVAKFLNSLSQQESVSLQKLRPSKSILIEMSYSKNPTKTLEAYLKGHCNTSRSVKDESKTDNNGNGKGNNSTQSNSPTKNLVQFKEDKNMRFSLKISSFDVNVASNDDRNNLINILKELLKRLERTAE